MEQDDAIVGSILSRRQALSWTTRASLVAAFGGMLVRSARAEHLPTTRPRLPLVATPDLTEGPFFIDEKLNRSDLLAGTTRPEVITGLPLLLGINVYKLADKNVTPLAGAIVDLWLADASGHYSDEDAPMNHEDTAGQKWLRGYQSTDAQGAVQFQLIFPGWYEGRTPHVHFKVRIPAADKKQSTAEFTSQFFFRDADIARIYASDPYAATTKHRRVSNATDGIYNQRTDAGIPAGPQLTLDLMPHPTGRGHAAVFPIVLTDASLAAGSRHDDHGRPPGPPPDFGGPDGFGPPP